MPFFRRGWKGGGALLCAVCDLRRGRAGRADALRRAIQGTLGTRASTCGVKRTPNKNTELVDGTAITVVVSSNQGRARIESDSIDTIVHGYLRRYMHSIATCTTRTHRPRTYIAHINTKVHRHRTVHYEIFTQTSVRHGCLHTG